MLLTNSEQGWNNRLGVDEPVPVPECHTSRTLTLTMPLSAALGHHIATAATNPTQPQPLTCRALPATMLSAATTSHPPSIGRNTPCTSSSARKAARASTCKAPCRTPFPVAAAAAAAATAFLALQHTEFLEGPAV